MSQSVTLEETAALLQKADHILLLTHQYPDGDTIGAALAWRAYLERLGHTTRCIAPNRYPYFLEWMTDIGYIGVFKEDADGEMAKFIGEADVIFCMDFNQINRLDRVTDTAMFAFTLWYNKRWKRSDKEGV